MEKELCTETSSPATVWGHTARVMWSYTWSCSSPNHQSDGGQDLWLWHCSPVGPRNWRNYSWHVSVDGSWGIYIRHDLCNWFVTVYHQVIKAKTYSEKCDLFSYGTLLWELVTHEVPFEDLHGVPFQIQVAIVKGNVCYALYYCTLPYFISSDACYPSCCWRVPLRADRTVLEHGPRCIANSFVKCLSTLMTFLQERPPFGEILKILKPHVIGMQVLIMIHACLWICMSSDAHYKACIIIIG